MKILEINNKWKRKYNRLCVLYEPLANEKIQKLETENDILRKNIQYRDELDVLKEEIKRYRKKFGKLEGGDKNDKSKNK